MLQSGPMTNYSKNLTIVWTLIKIQLTLGLVAVTAVAFFKHNANSICSGFVGLVLAIVPTVIYAKIAFGNGLVSIPVIAYSQHKKAMLSRFMLNLIFFAMVILIYKRCDYVALLLVYFVTLAGYWISLVKQ
jgi:hypothetical protein